MATDRQADFVPLEGELTIGKEEEATHITQVADTDVTFPELGCRRVVGETTEIGKRVRIYQGVTLGALSLPRDAGDRYRNKKRHPTIEDDVIVYSNATILGAEAIIGARSIIGGNVWLTESVPPDTKILLKRPELVYIGNGNKALSGAARGRRKKEARP